MTFKFDVTSVKAVLHAVVLVYSLEHSFEFLGFLREDI
jgi:hypothetical protein